MSRFLNRGNAILLAIAVMSFTLAACATPAETVAVATAAIGAAGAFIDQLAPILSPEMQAKLVAAAGSIDGTVSATSQAVGVIADAIAAFKTNVASQSVQFAEGIGSAREQLAAMPSREEVYAVGTGAGASGTLASRLLSWKKHGLPIKVSA